MCSPRAPLEETENGGGLGENSVVKSKREGFKERVGACVKDCKCASEVRIENRVLYLAFLVCFCLFFNLKIFIDI